MFPIEMHQSLHERICVQSVELFYTWFFLQRQFILNETVIYLGAPYSFNLL